MRERLRQITGNDSVTGNTSDILVTPPGIGPGLGDAVAKVNRGVRSMPYYMKIEGVAGTVTTGKYKGWIEIESCLIGARTSNANAGSARRDSNTPSEVYISKVQDSSSQALYKLSLWGYGVTATIDFVKQDQNEMTTYFSIRLENMLISGYHFQGNEGTRPFETLTLDSPSITFVTTGTGEPPKRAAVAQ